MLADSHSHWQSECVASLSTRVGAIGRCLVFPRQGSFVSDSTITNAVVGIRSIIGKNCTIQVSCQGCPWLSASRTPLQGHVPYGWSLRMR
jgi:hypothetical protein